MIDIEHTINSTCYLIRGLVTEYQRERAHLVLQSVRAAAKKASNAAMISKMPLLDKIFALSQFQSSEQSDISVNAYRYDRGTFA